MALIKCTECGKVFSDKVLSCPNCSCPTELILKEIKGVTAVASTTVAADPVIEARSAVLTEATVRLEEVEKENNAVESSEKSSNKSNTDTSKILIAILVIIGITALLFSLQTPKLFNRTYRHISPIGVYEWVLRDDGTAISRSRNNDGSSQTLTYEYEHLSGKVYQTYYNGRLSFKLVIDNERMYLALADTVREALDYVPPNFTS